MAEIEAAEFTFNPKIDRRSKVLSEARGRGKEIAQQKRGLGNGKISIGHLLHDDADKTAKHLEIKRLEKKKLEDQHLTFKPTLFKPPKAVQARYRTTGSRSRVALTLSSAKSAELTRSSASHTATTLSPTRENSPHVQPWKVGRVDRDKHADTSVDVDGHSSGTHTKGAHSPKPLSRR